MSQTTYKLCYVTCPNADIAQDLGRLAVSKHLAGCANIFPQMTSIYHWEGKLETSSEAVLILKTKSELVQPLKEIILSHHPYECPCFIELPITGGNEAYLTWLGSVVDHFT